MIKFFLWVLTKLPDLFELYKKYEERQKILALQYLDEEDERAIRAAWETQDAETLRAIFNNTKRVPAQPTKGE